MIKSAIAASLALAAVVAGATPGAADETFVANYSSLTGIVDGVFGAGNWVRVDDNADQIWAATPSGSDVGLQVISINAAWTQNLGYVQGGTFTPVLSPAAVGNTASVPIDGAFLFADLAKDNGHQFLWTSDPESNPDHPAGKDHMVTFLATSGAYEGQYILAFEDLPQQGDKDFNDIVFLASGVAPVPEPGTLVLLGGGLASLLAYARRKRAAV